ncbi:MAG: hypothetical protein HQK52_14050 [Oligoflexia bacterium]|nr:hypothetical protein [Oligoflexia bacterium]
MRMLSAIHCRYYLITLMVLLIVSLVSSAVALEMPPKIFLEEDSSSDSSVEYPQDVYERIERATSSFGNANTALFQGRHRIAILDLESFNMQTKESEKSTDTYAEPETIELNLFKEDQDANIIARKERVVRRGERDLTWIGSIDGDDLSMVILTMHEGNIAAQIDTTKTSYTIRPMGRGVHIVKEYKNSHHEDLKSDKDDFIVPDSNSDNQHVAKIASAIKNKGLLNTFTKQPSTSPSELEGNFIDVMIVVSDEVSSASADIAAEINTDIEYSNQALAKSCVQTRYRLVFAGTVSYTEYGYMDYDLYCITYPDIAYCGNQTNLNAATAIQSARDTYAADIVQFWVETNMDYCGIGWAPPLNVMDSTYGYSVKLRLCGSATSAHEIGHNLTLQHDRYQSRASMYNTSLGGNYGFVVTALKVRDIMSYNTECSDSGLTCSRIGYFANPRVVYQGIPFGIPNIADGAKALNASRVIAANYRTATSDYSPDVTSGCEAAAEKKAGASPCFIATAAYGTPLDRRLYVLRDFRDHTLLNYTWGKSFVKWYYVHAPQYAAIIEKHETLKFLVRTLILSPLIFSIQHPITPLTFFLCTLLLISVAIARKQRQHFFIYLLIGLPMVYATDTLSQVTSPSLDLSEKSINPGIVSINDHKRKFSVAGRMGEGTGSTDISGKNRESRDITFNEAVAAINASQFGAEAYSLFSRKDSITEKGASNSSFKTDRTEKETQLAVASSFTRYLSLGAGYTKNQVKLSSTTDDTTRMGGGSVVEFADLLSIGGAYYLVSNKKKDTKDNSWTYGIAGVGIKGIDLSFSWKIEVSYAKTPESVAAGTSEGAATNFHQATEDTTMGGEVYLGNDFISKLFIGSLNGVIVTASRANKKAKALSTSGSGEGSEESINVTKAAILLVLWRRQMQIGVSVQKTTATRGNNQYSESLMMVAGGFKF